jgi:hypothetical protein
MNFLSKLWATLVQRLLAPTDTERDLKVGHADWLEAAVSGDAVR